MNILRKINVYIALALLVIFLFHPIQSAFLLDGFITKDWKTIAWIGVGLLVIHALLGLYFSKNNIEIMIKHKKFFFKQEKQFWITRISGLLILVFMFFHFNMYGKMENGKYVVFPFTTTKLLLQLALVIALFVHIFVNIRPLLVSLGDKNYKKLLKVIFVILAIILAFVLFSVFYYYFK